MSRILEKLARWYFVNYLQPLVDDHLKARAAVDTMRKRYIGE